MNAIHALSQLSYSPTEENSFWNKNKNSKNLRRLSTIFLTVFSCPNIIFSENSTHYSLMGFCAGVVELEDARDSKSRVPWGRVGSIPTAGTK
jgi:hypothetical protein